MRFDVAPGGRPIKVEAVASEPAAIFGDYGRRNIMSGMVANLPQGAKGCIVRINFVMRSIAPPPQ
jgi:hypothetical protein